MHRSKIEWVLNPDNKTLGWVWNPLTGCLNNCEYCYARKLANGRLKSRYLANKNWDTRTPNGYEDYPNLDPFYPRIWEDKLDIVPERLKRYTVGERRYFNAVIKPKGVFVCDMSDLFGVGVPEEWTRRVLTEIEKLPQWRFYLLTKQPQNMAQWSPFPDNCFVGVSATDNEMAFNASCNLILVKAKIKFISFEPLLGRVGPAVLSLLTEKIQWVIIGSQTRPTVMPKIEWVQEIALACTKAHIPLFIKDNLKPLLAANPDYWDYHTGKALRQEMPK